MKGVGHAPGPAPPSGPHPRVEVQKAAAKPQSLEPGRDRRARQRDRIVPSQGDIASDADLVLTERRPADRGVVQGAAPPAVDDHDALTAAKPLQRIEEIGIVEILAIAMAPATTASQLPRRKMRPAPEIADGSVPPGGVERHGSGLSVGAGGSVVGQA